MSWDDSEQEIKKAEDIVSSLQIKERRRDDTADTPDGEYDLIYYFKNYVN